MGKSEKEDKIIEVGLVTDIYEKLLERPVVPQVADPRHYSCRQSTDHEVNWI